MTRKRMILAGVAAIFMAAILASFSKKNEVKNVEPVTRNTAPAIQNAETSTNIQSAAIPASPGPAEALPKAVLKTAQANGTRVYQIENMQVTVTPDGDVFYLPDEI